MLNLDYELLNNRIIMLTGHIDDELAKSIVSQLIYLEHKNPNKDISIYINSGGGSITAGMAIVDTMNFLKNDISTVCVGQAASMASFILAAGTKGKRYALPSSTIMIHSPSGGAVGKADVVMSEAEHLQKVKTKIVTNLAKLTNNSFENMEEQMSYDHFMFVDEALKLGIIDKII